MEETFMSIVDQHQRNYGFSTSTKEVSRSVRTSHFAIEIDGKLLGNWQSLKFISHRLNSHSMSCSDDETKLIG